MDLALPIVNGQASERSVTVLDELAVQVGKTKRLSIAEDPKEMFEEVLYLKKRRSPFPTILPRSRPANLSAWKRSHTFARFAGILSAWFPLEPERARGLL